MGVVEIVNVKLAPSSNVTDSSSPAAKALAESLKTVSSQPGFNKLFWGVETEDSSLLHLAIDWESLDAHKTFMSSSSYGPFKETLQSIVAAKPAVMHTNFKLQPGTTILPIAAPVTQLISGFFPASIGSGEVDSCNANFDKFASVLAKAPGFKGAASGWVHEEIENEKAGGKAKVAVSAVGWESVDAVKAFQGSAEYKENISLMKEGPKGIEIAYVKFQAN